MRGSASTQIAVDYTDELDFVQKFQLAQILSPVIFLLCENTPVIEGEKKDNFAPRAVIWNHVDRERCGIVPGSMEEDFSFSKYAEYVYHVPLIFVEEEGNARPVGESCAAEYYRERLMSTEEIEHMLSMVFPDVRLKNYIEIRMADSLPMERSFAYARLIRDIFYKNDIAKIRKFLGNPTKEEIEKAKENVIQYGSEGIVYEKRAKEIFQYLQEISREPMQILLDKERNGS
jgi:glutamate--cysteine ligase